MAPPRDDETDVREDRDWIDLPMAPVAPGQRRRGRSLETLVAIAIVAVVLAIAKPWTGAGVGATDPAAPAPRPAAAGAIVTPVPLSSVEPAEALAAELCLAPSGWRMFSTERWSDRLVRSWVGVIPLTGASGPEDSRIPFIDESSLASSTSGYCSPISGPERPASGDATTTIFRLVSGTPPGSPAGGSASPRSSASPQRWVVIRPRAGAADGWVVPVRRVVGAARRVGSAELAQRHVRVPHRRPGRLDRGRCPLVRGAGRDPPADPGLISGPASPRPSGSRNPASRSCRPRPSPARRRRPRRSALG